MLGGAQILVAKEQHTVFSVSAQQLFGHRIRQPLTKIQTINERTDRQIRRGQIKMCISHDNSCFPAAADNPSSTTRACAGGGINCSNDTSGIFHFENTEFLQNTSMGTSSGAALRISSRLDSADLTIVGGTIALNTAGSSGAAVIVPNFAAVSLTSTNWRHNDQGNSPLDLLYGCVSQTILGNNISLDVPTGCN